MIYEEITQRDPQELDKDINSGNSDLASKALFDYLESTDSFHELLDLYLRHMKSTDIVIAQYFHYLPWLSCSKSTCQHER